jgi:copper transport protein
MRRIARAGARSALVATLAVGWIALFAGAASAHALLVPSKAEPPVGSTLQKAPSEIVATFTEPPDPGLSHLHVLNSSGQQVDKTPTEAVPGKPLELRLPLPSLPDGTYTVAWQTVSKVDGHVAADSYAFGVGVGPPATPAGGAPVVKTPSPSVLSVIGKWGLYAGVSVLFAAGAVSLLVFGGIVPGGRRTVIAAWVVLLVGYFLMVVAERSTLGISLGTLLGSEAGRPLVDLGVAILVAGAGVVAYVVRPSRALLGVLAVLAAIVMLERVLGGHAAATQTFKWFNVGDQWVHILAVSTWIGGLVLLLLHVLRGGGGTQVRRFSTLAGFALAVVAVSGVFRAVDELGGWTEWGRLIHTSFGITLSLKIVLFVVLVALGAWNRYVNVPRVAPEEAPVLPEPPRVGAHTAPIAGGSGDGEPRTSLGARMRPLRAVVTAELVIAAGIFGLTGVLTGLPPAASAAQPPAPPAHVTVTGHDFATTVRVQLTATPGLVGQNAFRVSVTDYDTGKPVPATDVSLQFSLPSQPEASSTLELKKTAPGIWNATGTNLSIEGTWNVSVLVQEATTSATVALKVQTRTIPPKVTSILGTNGTPTIYTNTFANGEQIQTYLDPGKPGVNQLHITAFDPQGDELGLKSCSAKATGPGGTKDLQTKRFDEPQVPKDKRGHFVANTQLTPGTWSFTVTASALDGTLLVAKFTQTIG